MKNYSCRYTQNTLQRAKSKLRQNSKGLTLVELLVALVLSSLLLSFVFSLHLFSNKLVFNWQMKAALEDATLLCIETLSRDIGNIDEILDAGKANLSIMTRSGKEISYKLKEDQVQRNEESLNKDKIVAVDLEFIYLTKTTNSDTAGAGIIDIGSDFSFLSKQDELKRISGIKIKMTFSGYGKSITSSSFTRLRRAISVY